MGEASGEKDVESPSRGGQETSGKCPLKCKKPSKTLEWKLMRLALVDPNTGPTASEEGVLGIWVSVRGWGG